MKDYIGIILNPVRIRIIQELALRPSVTATELCEKINDVPRTTMYRHINILLKHQILSVVSQKKVRGSLERTLALNAGEITKMNTVGNATQLALGFMMNKYAAYHRYFAGKNPDPAKDKIFLNNSVLMMNDGEFDQFLSELRELIIRFNFEAAPGRKARDISIMSAPVEDEKSEPEPK